MTQTVAVIDYGMGNLHSVESALREACASDVLVTADAEAILAADRIVFPGVGAIRDCLAEFRRLGCETTLRLAVDRGTPVLGICVGMQSLMARSDENGGVDCLGFFDGTVTRFPRNHSDTDGTKLKVPHMGWNQVAQSRNHPLWDGIADNAYFYFVHSFFLPAEESDHVAGSFDYGIKGSAAIAKDNVFATQFHPEKSHDNGLKLLANFLRWDGTC
ncbi:MAG: imidazole glycerol phosphate synthase subunit HisH [Pseudomonadota bacterium]|nr:imidazole glycerol phosphate synthase subunit HisH [Pseudomonadota bacterium]